MKLATKRILIQTYSSYASGLGVDEGTGGKPRVLDVPTYGSNDEQIFWKFSDEEDDDKVGTCDDDDTNDDDDDDADNQDDDGQEYDGQDDEGQDDDNEQTNSDNDGDDFVHPKFSTHDEEVRHDEEDKEEEFRSEGVNVEGEEMDEEETNEEEEVNKLYKDVNVNLEGRDTKMTYANAQATQVIEDTHVIITTVTPEVQHLSSSVSSGFISNMLNPNPNTGIDSILNLNTESTSLVDVPVITNVKMPPSSVTTLFPPPIHLIQPLQQTPVPTPTTVPSTSLQNLPTFGSLFKFEDRVKAIENEISCSTKSDKLRDEAQAENEDFINTLDDNIKKIIKEQVKEQAKAQVSKILPKIKKAVNEQLKADVLTRSSNKSKTSHVVAVNLSKLELKKILIDKMERNKSLYRSDEQKNLYKALVDAYETDKLILEMYGDSVSFKRRRDDEDEDEEPSAGSKWGSKRRRARKEPELTSAPKEKTSKSSGKSKEGSKSHHMSTGKSAQAEEPIHADEDLEESTHQEFDTGFTKDQPVDEITQHHDWFQKPTKPPTPDQDTRDSFNELKDTPLDFLAFVMNQLKVDTLTPELLVGLTFELMKGLCKQYPHDLCKPLPLIPNSQGRRVIPFDHFINNDLAYLRGGTSSRTYATSVTKTKAADYGHVKWIEDLGQKRQQFYEFAVNRESAHDVYSRHKIIAVIKLQIAEWHNYKHLDCTARRNDDKLYTCKEGDYKRLHL
ncbi:hypothetical protein Tco_1437152 [Tanacetum coccineum]